MKHLHHASRRACHSGVVCPRQDLKTEYDAVIIGAGHNGLVTGAYLARAGKRVCVLERRHVVGGAAVTEELLPGFKYSRASYVLSLLRPQVYEDLELKKHGLEVYLRNPNSYTPLLTPTGKDGKAKSLLISGDKEATAKSIAQFSQKDAKRFFEYEKFLAELTDAVTPLLDAPPPNMSSWKQKSLKEKISLLIKSRPLIKSASQLSSHVTAFYELMTAPAAKLLDRWFESEPLKATLATDSVIGAMTSPQLPGSGYVLMHHVMGGIEIEGVQGAWGYVKGGMGAVSDSIAKSARSHGAHIFTDSSVSRIDVGTRGEAQGVVLQDGSEVKAKAVISNATAKVTYLDLIEKSHLPSEFLKDVSLFDFTSPVTKINVAVSRIPNFLADPVSDNQPGPVHRGTIHLNSEDSQYIHEAYLDACRGHFSKRPVIEMTIPSSIDPTVAPPGAHVVQLFTQYTPYTLADGQVWDDENRNKYADLVFDYIEDYAPGFKESVLHRDILTPPDLERVFGLTGGNIFHGAMSLDQLFINRPVPGYCDYKSPVRGLYNCGSSAHPGGGVMGAAGRLAALTVLQDNIC